MEELNNTLQDILTEKETKLIPENIKKDVTILGVTGTSEGEGADTSDATAVAGDILEGKTAYTADGKVIGTFVQNVSDTDYNSCLAIANAVLNNTELPGEIVFYPTDDYTFSHKLFTGESYFTIITASTIDYKRIKATRISGSTPYNYTGVFYSSKPVSLSRFADLKISMDLSYATSRTCKVAVVGIPVNNVSASALTYITPLTQLSGNISYDNENIDVSSINGEFYLGIYVAFDCGAGDYYTQIDMKEMSLYV